MARIPEEELERIKQQTDLAALVRSRGIELKKHGSRDWSGCCPFHEDAEPSFIVSPAKGLFHCMGCGAAGNAIQFVERFDKISFRHAYELLAEGSPAVFSQKAAKRLENPLEPEAGDAQLMEQVVDYYHERLFKVPAALDYLKGRGLDDPDTLRRFRIGFADRSLGLRLPEKNRQEGQRIRERLQALGILRESGHEHFNGSITVPIFDASGHVAEMYGRKITQRLRKGTPLHLYLPGSHAGIWNRQGLSFDTSASESEVILCEAPLDALTFCASGFINTTFIYGTQGFTDELFDALLEHNIRTVRLAYDNDDAGNRAAKRDAERLASVGIEVFRIRFPHGMDANEYAVKVRPASRSLRTAIQSAEWVAGSSRAHAPTDIVNESLAANLVASPEPVEAAEEKSLPENPVHPVHPVKENPTLERRGEYHFLELGEREYRVGGLDKNNSLDVLKITLRIAVRTQKADDVCFHLDSIDLAKDGERRRFIERSHEETRLEKALIKRDLGRLLLLLEEAQLIRIDAAL
ncbi:MAG TPA: CHC2 zinc finger domain-containing protein [Pontiella sp.]|nr:CHC2 zinc finger domain-containing protein [Pontiella sp.]